MVWYLFSAKPSQKPSQLLLAILLAGSTAGAQSWEKEQLPLAFAQASPDLAKAFARDWRSLERAGREHYYCVTRWHVETARDGDSLFVADSAVLVPLRGSRDRITSVPTTAECRAEDGSFQPIAHTHLGGDCSPSRADVASLLGRGGFGLIICGSRSVTGYVSSLYSLALRAPKN